MLLLVEVSNSSLRYDRDIKVPLYAKYGIPEVWLVDLEINCLHIFREPKGNGYQSSAVSKHPDQIERLPGIHIDLSGVLDNIS